MKILFLTSLMLPDSGSGRCAVDIVAGIRGAGHEVVILKEVDDGCEGLPVLKRRGGIFHSVFLVRNYIKECDVIHALDGYPFGIIAALANIGLKRKLVITAIGTYSVEPLYRWKTSRLLAWAYHRALQVVCISRYTQSQILMKVPLANCSVANLGIDVAAFATTHEPSEERYLLSVGAVKFRKGYHVSIRAFSELIKKFPGIKYKIVGGLRDIQYERMRQLTDRLDVARNVQFLGEVSDDELRSLYRHARIFILTSVNQGHHFEGYGLVCLEAAAAGLPVIGTKGTGIEDAVRDGYNGMLVEQDDIEATTKAMTVLLHDEAVWSAMSANGHEWAKRHDRDESVKPYLRLYESK